MKCFNKAAKRFLMGFRPYSGGWPGTAAAPVLLALALTGFAAAQAAELYRYRDDQGRWVFTDRKPAHSNYERESLLVTQSRQRLQIVNRGTDQRPVLYAVNPLAGPVQFWLDIDQQDNLRFSQEPPFIWVVAGPADQLLLHMERADPSAGWAYHWRGNFVPGAPISDDALDLTDLGLPFQGGPFVVSQGFKGEHSHQHIQAHYALDIAMPEGTPIVAVRAGRVMSVENRFSRSGLNKAYAGEANKVRVLHADGSMAVYGHLKTGSVEVQPGQMVERAQRLAQSGNTGFSSGPHLHFVVQINRGKELVSVPFLFEGTDRPPERGARLRNLQH